MIPLPFGGAVDSAKRATPGIDFSHPRFKGTVLYAPPASDPTTVDWDPPADATTIDVAFWLPDPDDVAADDDVSASPQDFRDAVDVARAYLDGAIGSWWPIQFDLRERTVPARAWEEWLHWIRGGSTLTNDYEPKDLADHANLFMAPTSDTYGDHPWARIGSAHHLARIPAMYQGGGPRDGDDAVGHEAVVSLLHEVGHCLWLGHRDGTNVDGAPTPMNLYSSQGYYERAGINFVVYDYAASCKHQVRRHLSSAVEPGGSGGKTR